MNLITYSRVSTDKQDASLEAQQASMEKFANGLDHTIIGNYAETQSGKSADDRKVLQEALQFIKDGHADGLVVYKLDRLGRDACDLLTISRDYFEKAGKALLIVDMRIDTSTWMGKMFFTIVAAFAESERNRIIERTRDALRHRKATGKVYCGRLFGTSGQKGEVRVPSPQDTETISEILRLRGMKRTYREIAEQLNLLDVPPPVGEKKGQKCIWHPGTIQRIVKRETTNV